MSKSLIWPAGSFIAARRDGLEAVDGFDETYYASEEIHLGKALKKWAKTKKLKCLILDIPVVTSARKIDWFTPWQILKFCVVAGLFPSRLKRRDTCDIWYTRPNKQ